MSDIEHLSGASEDQDHELEGWFTIEAPGEYDPELQLTPEQVIAFKELLKNDTSINELRVGIVVEIVMKLLLPDGDDDESFFDKEDLKLLKNPRVVQMLGQFASLSGSWEAGLTDALHMPDSEWPEGMSPPATFAGALIHTDLLRGRKKRYDRNPNIDFSVEKRQILEVTGIDVDKLDAPEQDSEGEQH